LHCEFKREVNTLSAPFGISLAVGAFVSQLFRSGSKALFMQIVRQCLAEGIGTFLLCLTGISVVLSSAPPVNSGIGFLGIALANGFALAALTSWFSGISGAHFNPAITLALLTTRRIKWPLGIAYLVTQILSGTLAAYGCNMMFPDSAIDWTTMAIPISAQWVTENKLVFVEVTLTFALMLAYYSTLIDPRGGAQKIGAFGIGLTVVVAMLAAGPITGACMNPVRAFGPCWVMNRFPQHWCYWIGPITGAILAAQIYENILLPHEPSESNSQSPPPPSPKGASR
jgi:MIP family channel proteins